MSRLEDAAQNLRDAYERYVDEVVTLSPDLTPEQVDLLRSMIPPLLIPNPQITAEQAAHLFGTEPDLPRFTCPRCQRTSYNPNDVREGYCGACHEFTGRPAEYRPGIRGNVRPPEQP